MAVGRPSRRATGQDQGVSLLVEQIFDEGHHVGKRVAAQRPHQCGEDLEPVALLRAVARPASSGWVASPLIGGIVNEARLESSSSDATWARQRCDRVEGGDYPILELPALPVDLAGDGAKVVACLSVS
jgi:hypothetical protein